MALHGTKALETWCKNITASYQPQVNIVNMTTSWRNGLGFCAIIHHHCPHLIDWSSLEEDDVYRNNKLAFDMAEQHLGVPSLLDPQDMVECELLDRLSILTYLSQYYQAFHSHTVQARVRKMAGGGSLSKSSSINSDLTDASGGLGSATSSPRKIPTIGRLSDPCRICQKSVFILERLNIGGRIVHRTCFRCGRCGTQLSLAGYYETEAGEYCCELCPDEEKQEEFERKCSLDDTTNETKLDNNNSIVIKQDNDSGHSSDEDLDIGEDDMSEIDKETDDDCRSNISDVKVNVDNFNHENVKPLELDQDSCSLKDNQSYNITIEKNTIDDKELTEKADENVECVDNTVEISDNNDKLEDIIDENSNNFQSLKIDKNENTEEVFEAQGSIEYPDDKNPFGDDDDEDEEQNQDTAAANFVENKDACDINPIETIGTLPHTEIKPSSTNPFGSDIESDEDESNRNMFVKSNTPAVKDIAQTSQIKFTPSPVPSLAAVQVPASYNSKEMKKSLNPFGEGFSSDEEASVGTVSPALSIRSHVKSSKKRRAPPPPPGASPRLSGSSKSISQHHAQSSTRSPSPRTSGNSPSYTSAEEAKRIKDENNLNRRSQILEHSRSRAEATRNFNTSANFATGIGDPMTCSDISQSESTNNITPDNMSIISTQSSTRLPPPPAIVHHPPQNKTEEGQWRKKKGPAPPRPIPPRRTVRKLHRKAINQELEDIEIKQNELERQGVKLEKSIRHICDREDELGENRDSLGPEAEDLIIQLFDLVNEKNELFRRQTELIYMKKDNRLEEQHADLEHQIRVLMSKPDTHKTDEDTRKEEKLIKKLVEIVSQRNEIVDCLEMDRLRELEEDTAIEDHMSSYAAVQPTEEITKKSLAAKLLRIRNKKKKKKQKDVDSEKDIDESEAAADQVLPQTSPADQQTSQNKKKSTKKKKIIKYAKKLNFTQ